MNHLSRLAAALLAVTTLGGPGACAADTSVGLQAGVMQPLGDLKTFTANSAGVAVGAHLLVDLGAGQTVRPRLDFVSYPGKVGHFKLTQFSGGVDYVYFLQGAARAGGYLVAGAGLASNNYETFQPAFARADVNPYLALGAGWQINAGWGVEVRYNSSRYTDQTGNATPVNGVGLMATVRF